MRKDRNKVYAQIKNYFSDKPVKKVFVFGSFAHNDDKAFSDIDLIIYPSHTIGLFALGKYVADLEELTKRKIDLTTKNCITPEFLSLIQNDLKEVYAA